MQTFQKSLPYYLYVFFELDLNPTFHNPYIFLPIILILS